MLTVRWQYVESVIISHLLHLPTTKLVTNMLLFTLDDKDKISKEHRQKPSSVLPTNLKTRERLLDYGSQNHVHPFIFNTGVHSDELICLESSNKLLYTLHSSFNIQSRISFFLYIRTVTNSVNLVLLYFYTTDNLQQIPAKNFYKIYPHWTSPYTRTQRKEPLAS